MIATTIGGRTIGIRNVVRIASSTFERALSISATPSPARIWRRTVKSESRVCTQTELANRSSPSSST
jgi:hypothetical protein